MSEEKKLNFVAPVVGGLIQHALGLYVVVMLGPEVWDELKSELEAEGLKVGEAVTVGGCPVGTTPQLRARGILITIGDFVVLNTTIPPEAEVEFEPEPTN